MHSASSTRATIASILFYSNETAPTQIYTLSLHDALPICNYAIKVAISQFPASQSFHVTQWGQFFNSSHFEYLAGDFTGDGRTDLLRIDRPASGRACDVPFWVMRSVPGSSATTGSFSTDSGPWARACTNEPDRARYLVANVPDSDGHHRADVIAIAADSDQPSDKTMALFHSTGSGFGLHVLEFPAGGANVVNS